MRRKAAAARTAKLETLEIGDGVSEVTAKRGRLRLVPHAKKVALGGVIVEQVAGDELLLLCGPQRGATVNGEPAPPVAVVGEKDQIALDEAAESIAYVAVYREPNVGPATGSIVGNICPVCRTAVRKGTRVYRCSNCGTTIHLEQPDESPEADGDGDVFDCALRVPNCPGCRRPIQLHEGYSWVPEV